MKTIIPLVSGLILLSSCGTAIAQQTQEHTLIIEGELNYIQHPMLEQFEGPLQEPLDFVASITEDITSPSPYAGFWNDGIAYENVTITLTFELYDAQGGLIFSDSQSTSSPDHMINDTVALFFDSASNQPIESAIWGIIDTETQTMDQLRSEYVLGQNYFRSRTSQLPSISGPLFATTTPYHFVDTGITSYPFQYAGDLNWTPFTFEGVALNVRYIGVDDDGDGIANEVDACEASILDETVLFDGWYDSGVTNYVDDSGCSVMDHYAACAAEEQEAPRRGIRSVRSGPSSCEKAVSYDLVADGVLSYSEARMLRNALYESSTSSGPQ
ncbi:hypothetical protein CWE21_03000 [Pseudidiomarina aquimaris]|uniref:Uncharacterized protein n=1 Tax=Pseudidiomarina aquimaris TaxID=641841 RepID=A0A432XN14_9GAMM|nr:hypothetical protein [Pseudidiomarina aquimaris]RUO50108.1 hypothetical protein CWE21_03000 [Pseudidiomarina aquimaris]